MNRRKIKNTFPPNTAKLHLEKLVSKSKAYRSLKLESARKDPKDSQNNNQALQTYPLTNPSHLNLASSTTRRQLKSTFTPRKAKSHIRKFVSKSKAHRSIKLENGRKGLEDSKIGQIYCKNKVGHLLYPPTANLTSSTTRRQLKSTFPANTVKSHIQKSVSKSKAYRSLKLGSCRKDYKDDKDLISQFRSQKEDQFELIVNPERHNDILQRVPEDQPLHFTLENNNNTDDIFTIVESNNGIESSDELDESSSETQQTNHHESSLNDLLNHFASLRFVQNTTTTDDNTMVTTNEIDHEAPPVGTEQCPVCFGNFDLNMYASHVISCVDRLDAVERLRKITVVHREEDASADNSDNKGVIPECEYGVRCYGTEPEHFINYSHPKEHLGPGSIDAQGKKVSSSFLDSVTMVHCPICSYRLADFQVDAHLDRCLSKKESPDDEKSDKLDEISGPAFRTPSVNRHFRSVNDSDDDDMYSNGDDDHSALNVRQMGAFAAHALKIRDEKGDGEFDAVLKNFELLGFSESSMRRILENQSKEKKKE